MTTFNFARLGMAVAFALGLGVGTTNADDVPQAELDAMRKALAKYEDPYVAVRDRLKQLSARMGDTDWLDGAFSAGDLMMVHVLQRLKPSGILGEFPNLAAYVARGEARPAYKRAFDAQAALYTGNASAG